MYKAAVIGDYDSIYGFGALGLDVFPTDGDLTQAAHQLRRLCEGNYAVVYITVALKRGCCSCFFCEFNGVISCCAVGSTAAAERTFVYVVNNIALELGSSALYKRQGKCSCP